MGTAVGMMKLNNSRMAGPLTGKLFFLRRFFIWRQFFLRRPLIFWQQIGSSFSRQ